MRRTGEPQRSGLRSIACWKGGRYTEHAYQLRNMCMIVLCRTRSEKEVKKHVQRRKKRKRDKAVELPEDGPEPAPAAAAHDAQEAQDEVTASDLLAPLQVTCNPSRLPSSHVTQAGGSAAVNVHQ